MRFALLLIACAAPAADLKDLAFLSGCWTNKAGVDEVWLKPAGGSMMGMSRTVKDGKTVFTEFLHISAAGADIVLNVQLRLAEKSTQFKLASLENGVATFSNPQHDYPQRVIYRREPDGSLLGRIEGTVNGAARHTDFRYSRSQCE